MEDMEKATEGDIVSYNLQRVEAVESSKMNERCVNVIENKWSAFSSPGPSGNIAENKRTYAQNPGMSLITMGVIGNAASRAASISPVNTMAMPREPNGDGIG
jgi:hypothetical protein